MGSLSLIIRPFQAGDIDGAMKLSSDAGWNQTAKDWRLLTKSPQNICITAECDKKIIGTTTAVIYSNQVAWIGMVLVDKQYRGHGVSKLLLTTVFKQLQNCSSIKLDATNEGQPVYKKLGFEDEYRISRMVNASLKNIAPADDEVLPAPVQLHDIREIISLDESVFGANRSQLISFLLTEYLSSTWLIKRNDRIAGFALGREGIRYHQVGPVLTSTTNEAKILIKKALSRLINRSIVVDVPVDKEELIHWLHSMGFTQERQFTRMYKNENPLPGIPEHQYLICGPEFG